MDYHLTWYKWCPHWDDAQWSWPWSIHQRSMSHNTFKGQTTLSCVRAITTYALMDYHLTWYKWYLIETMCSDLDPDPYLKGQGHTTYLKVRVHMLVSIYPKVFRLPIKPFVFPIFPFLTSGSVQFWYNFKYCRLFTMVTIDKCAKTVSDQ